MPAMRVILVLILLTVVGFINAQTNASTRVAKPLPEFTLKDLNGASVTKSNFAGRAMLVWIFASHDGPSRRQLPAIQEVHAEFAGRGVAVLGVAVDPKGPAGVKAFAATNNLAFPVVMGELDFLLACEKLEAVPTMYIVEPGGYVVSQRVGVTDRATLASDLEAALAVVKE
jgi:peroxiredoxin